MQPTSVIPHDNALKGILTCDTLTRYLTRCVTTTRPSPPTSHHTLGKLSTHGEFVLFLSRLLTHQSGVVSPHTYARAYRHQLTRTPRETTVTPWYALCAVTPLMCTTSKAQQQILETWLRPIHSIQQVQTCIALLSCLKLASAGADKTQIIHVFYSALPKPLKKVTTAYLQRQRFVTDDSYLATNHPVFATEVARALYVFKHSHSFEENVCKNLQIHGRASARGLICGALAGAFYGPSQQTWKKVQKACLKRRSQPQQHQVPPRNAQALWRWPQPPQQLLGTPLEG